MLQGPGRCNVQELVPQLQILESYALTRAIYCNVPANVASTLH